MDKDSIEAQRTVKNINLDDVSAYFRKKDYKVLDIEQQWRHVTGILEKDGDKYFLKLASTELIGEKTKNEAEWNKLLKLLSVETKLPITIPKMLEEGFFKELYWFLSDYIDGKPLVLPTQKNETKDLEQYIPTIADTTKNILEINTDELLPNDVPKVSKENLRNKYIKHIEDWIPKIHANVSELHSFFKKRLQYFEPAPAHGDYVPWHILKDTKNYLYLVDAEHSGIKRVKFYDLAYFYHRVYTKLKRPDLADEYLKQFRNLWDFDNNDLERVRLVLAHKVMSGYFDLQEDGITSAKLQDELRKRLLSGKVI